MLSLQGSLVLNGHGHRYCKKPVVVGMAVVLLVVEGGPESLHH